MGPPVGSFPVRTVWFQAELETEESTWVCVPRSARWRRPLPAIPRAAFPPARATNAALPAPARRSVRRSIHIESSRPPSATAGSTSAHHSRDTHRPARRHRARRPVRPVGREEPPEGRNPCLSRYWWWTSELLVRSLFTNCAFQAHRRRSVRPSSRLRTIFVQWNRFYSAEPFSLAGTVSIRRVPPIAVDGLGRFLCLCRELSAILPELPDLSHYPLVYQPSGIQCKHPHWWGLASVDAWRNTIDSWNHEKQA